METKVCSKCKDEKPISEFHKKNSNKDGFCGTCKKCICLHKKEYYKDNKDRLFDYCKKRYNEKKDQIIKQRKKYALLNSNKIKDYKSNYYLKNKKTMSKNAKENYYKNRDERLNYAKIYKSKNLEKYTISKKNINKKERDSLTDSYVRRVICPKDVKLRNKIPSELVHAERERIKLKRLIISMSN